MKRIPKFLALALLFAAGGCSDSGTDDSALPEAPAPAIVLAGESMFRIAAEGGAESVAYAVENPVEGRSVAASTTESWIHSFDGSEAGRIAFTADANESEELRLANIELTYEGAERCVVSVLQPPVDKALTFDIRVSAIESNSAVVAWTPSDAAESYVPMVVEKAVFDGCATDDEYIRSDIEYMKGLAAQYDMTFAQVLAEFLAQGPTGEQTISGLAPDTDYYAYAYGMTAEGAATSAISKVGFRTAPFSCEFTLAAETTDSSAAVGVTPSNTGCYYFWDMVPKADYEAWGDDRGVVDANVQLIRQAVEIMQAGGYPDVDFTYFLTVGPTTYTFEELLPDSDYVLFAFALDETGTALTGVTKTDVRTKPFEATENCSFAIGFSKVTSSAFNVDVEPSNDATRYYIGVCTTALFERNSPDAIAASFIAMENKYGTDWAGDQYIYTGRRSVDTFYGLMMGSLDASTDYTAVVFGVDTAGKRTTEVAHASQRTADVAASNLTIQMVAKDITYDGASIVIYPSNAEESYYVDCIPYADYEAFAGDEEACMKALVENAGSYIDYFLMQGNQTLDCHGYLDADTRYIAVAFGYASGITTPLFKSEPFTTEPLRVDGKATVDIAVSIENGDDYYASDPTKFASYKGKAVVYGEVEPSADASKWYVGAFTADMSDRSDAEMTAYLLAKGYENRNEVASLSDWGASLTFVGVALDADGVAGQLLRKVVAVEKPAANSVRTLRRRGSGSLPPLEAVDAANGPTGGRFLPKEHAAAVASAAPAAIEPRGSLETYAVPSRRIFARWSSVASLRERPSRRPHAASFDAAGLRLRRF